jgi:hypothetical protein
VKVGDLVERTYGEGQRPRALFIGWYLPNIYSNAALVIWQGASKPTQFNSEHLEVISESR